MSKKEIESKELKTILAKDISVKNPILSPDLITELHQLFSLYADPRMRRADSRDLLQTAQTLGLDVKYELVFKVLNDINDNTGGQALDFETWLKELTNRLGNPFTEEGRRASFTILDLHSKDELDLNDLAYISDQLKYGYTEEQLVELIHTVGGYGAESISWDKFNRFIEKKINKRKLGM